MFIKGMETGQRRMNIKVCQKLARMTGVFRGNQVDFLQDAQGAQRNVFQISNRGADQIETAGGFFLFFQL